MHHAVPQQPAQPYKNSILGTTLQKIRILSLPLCGKNNGSIIFAAHAQQPILFSCHYERIIHLIKDHFGVASVFCSLVSMPVKKQTATETRHRQLEKMENREASLTLAGRSKTVCHVPRISHTILLPGRQTVTFVFMDNQRRNKPLHQHKANKWRLPNTAWLCNNRNSRPNRQ